MFRQVARTSQLAPARTSLQLAPNGELGASWSEMSEPKLY